MIEYYKENYNKDIVEEAIVCSEQCDSTLELNKLKIRLILDKIENSANDDTINKICEFINKSNKNRFIDGYMRGIAHAIIREYGKDKLSNTNKEHCEYVKNKDFAFVYHFGDNDFGGYFMDVALEYLDRYQHYLDNIDEYSKANNDGGMASYYTKDIDMYENHDNIVNLFKILFKGFYLSSYEQLQSDCISFEESEKKIQHYLDYLNINIENFTFGTCEEIDTYVKENFTRTFGGKECIWDNGETLVIKILGGKCEYKLI